MTKPDGANGRLLSDFVLFPVVTFVSLPVNNERCKCGDGMPAQKATFPATRSWTFLPGTFGSELVTCAPWKSECAVNNQTAAFRHALPQQVAFLHSLCSMQEAARVAPCRNSFPALR